MPTPRYITTTRHITTRDITTRDTRQTTPIQKLHTSHRPRIQTTIKSMTQLVKRNRAIIGTRQTQPRKSPIFIIQINPSAQTSQIPNQQTTTNRRFLKRLQSFLTPYTTNLPTVFQRRKLRQHRHQIRNSIRKVHRNDNLQTRITQQPSTAHTNHRPNHTRFNHTLPLNNRNTTSMQILKSSFRHRLHHFTQFTQTRINQ